MKNSFVHVMQTGNFFRVSTYGNFKFISDEINSVQPSDNYNKGIKN
jgi:hypothetical protein